MDSQAPEPKTSTADKPNGVESSSPLPDSASADSNISTVNPLSRDLVEQPPAIPDYQLLQRIGGGSYGEVWLARSATGALRALKIVWRHTFDDDRPFQREFEGIQCFERLSREHPSQLALFHVGRGEGYFFYVMELADNACQNPNPEVQNPIEIRNPNAVTAFANHELHASESVLPSTFDIRHSSFYVPHTLRADLAHGRLPAARVLEIALTLTSALHALHEAGLVHRDIKPSNIIFVGGRPKLADIGLVTDTGDARSIVGTEGYLAPEGPGAPQADIFALGKVLYEAATGLDRRQFPQLPPDLRSWPDAKLVFELNEIFLKACAAKACERYANAEEMGADLALLQRGQSVKRRQARRQMWTQAKRAGIVLGILTAAVALIATFWHPQPPTLEEERKHSTNEFAQTQYDIGRNYYLKDTEADVARAAEYFQRAFKADTNFALAQAALAISWSWPTSDTNDNFVLLPRAKEIAERALAKDPTLNEAHLAVAWHAFIKDWNFHKAEAHFQMAIKYDPLNPQPFELYGLFLSFIGRTNEGIFQLQKAVELNPRSQTANRFLGQALLASHQYSAAIAKARKSVDLEPEPGNLYWLGKALEADGKIEEAIAILERWSILTGDLPADARDRAAELLRAFEFGGKRGYWEKMLQIRRTEKSPLIDIAEAAGNVGNKDEALDLLERAYQIHDYKLLVLAGLKTSEAWDCLRDEPRFKALLRKMQL